MADYVLDDQVGFILRRANQRHLGIFGRAIRDLTPRQFAALAKLCEAGAMSQNALGRATAMDAATVKGVVDRLRARGLVEAAADPEDQRRMSLAPTAEGRAAFARLSAAAEAVTRETLAPLTVAERAEFLRLLGKLV